MQGVNEEAPRVRKAKKCLKICSVGPVNNGVYFKSNQQYLSVCSGIFTIMGLLVVLGLSIKVFINIANET